MKDPEFIQLRNKFLISLAVCVLFIIPTIIFMYNKLIIKDSNIETAINDKESLLILITNNTCKNCKEIENILIGESVPYNVVNKDTSKDYKTILKKLNMTETDIDIPTLIYVNEGMLYSTLVSIDDEIELREYIKYNKFNE